MIAPIASNKKRLGVNVFTAPGKAMVGQSGQDLRRAAFRL